AGLFASGSTNEEFVTARSVAPVPITGLRVRLRRPQARLVVMTSATERFTVEAGKERTLWIPLPTPVIASCVSIVGVEVGGITDLEVITAASGPEKLVQAIADGEPCQGQLAMLVGLGTVAAPSI